MSTTTPSALAAYPARYFDAWNGRDIDAVAPLLADDFLWTDPLLPEPLTNLAGAHAFFTGTWAGFPDIAFELIGGPMVDEGSGTVAQEWRMTGTHQGEFPAGVPATGKPFDVSGTDVFAVDAEGRATAVRAYYDALGLMRQLGLA